MEEDYPYKSEICKFIGAVMEIHKTLSCGFLEAVYQEALAIEFERKIFLIRKRNGFFLIRAFNWRSFTLLILFVIIK